MALALRSALTLLLVVAVAGLMVQHAAVPQRSGIAELINGTPASKGIIVRDVAPTATPTIPPVPTGVPTPTARPTATPIVVQPGISVSVFPNVRGHIFYTGVDHNIYFITRQDAKNTLLGSGAVVAPSVSTDGKKLAWIYLSRNYSDILIANLSYRSDGSVLVAPATRLTQDDVPPPALQLSPSPPGYQPSYEWYATKPSWLSDDQHLLYVSDRPGYDPNNPENATMSVWEQAATDPITNAVRLTTPASGTGGHDSAQWRPHDPSVFMYVDYYQDTVTLPGGQGVIEVATAPSSTVPTANPTGGGIATNIVGLTPHGATEYHPTWSPDGRYIAFVEDRGHNRTDLKVMPFHRPGFPLDYYHAVIVAHGSPWVSQPFWSPDGRYLGYLTSDSGNFQMVIRRAYLTGKTPHFGPPIVIQQAGAVSAEYRPTWGP